MHFSQKLSKIQVDFLPEESKRCFVEWEEMRILGRRWKSRGQQSRCARPALVSKTESCNVGKFILIKSSIDTTLMPSIQNYRWDYTDAIFYLVFWRRWQNGITSRAIGHWSTMSELTNQSQFATVCHPGYMQGILLYSGVQPFKGEINHTFRSFNSIKEIQVSMSISKF